MDKKKIEELRKRLDKLEGKEKQIEKPMGNLSSSFEEIGKSFRDVKENMPKIKLGKDKPQQPVQYDPSVNKLKKFLLWFLTILVGGLAMILLITRVLKRLI